MKVLIDATSVSKGGMQTYLLGLLRAWAGSFPDDVLHVVATDETIESLDRADIKPAVVWSIGDGRQRNRIWAQQQTVRMRAKAWHPDVVLCLAPVVPLMLKHLPLVCVAHDFRHLHRPQEFGFIQRAYRRVIYPLSLRLSDLIIANSERTANEVRGLLGRRQVPIRVVYMGATQHHERVLNRLVGRHALAFGHWTNKQPDISIKAWGELRKLMPGLDTTLRVVGIPDDQIQPLRHLARECGVDDLVDLTGLVPDDQYWPLFQSARLVLMPSTFEGFGMPIIEALAAGVPVVASEGVGLEEAGKDHILYAPPNDPRAFASHCRMILTGDVTQIPSPAEGWVHASAFTWSSTALDTRTALQLAIQRATTPTT